MRSLASYVMCLGVDHDEGMKTMVHHTHPDQLGPLLGVQGTGVLLVGSRLALSHATRVIHLEATRAPRLPSKARLLDGSAWVAEHNAWIIATALGACPTHHIGALYYGPFTHGSPYVVSLKRFT